MTSRRESFTNYMSNLEFEGSSKRSTMVPMKRRGARKPT